MNCREARRRLDDPAMVSDPSVKNHLRRCAACSTLASRLEATRDALIRRHAGVTPGPEFSTRVATNLPDRLDEPLGWAALRLLPGTLVLVLLLSWLAWRNGAPTGAEVAPAPTQDLLNWVATHAPEKP